MLFFESTPALFCCDDCVVRSASTQWDLICAACREGQRVIRGGTTNASPADVLTTDACSREEQTQRDGSGTSAAAESPKVACSIKTQLMPLEEEKISEKAAEPAKADATETVTHCDFCPLRGEMFVLLLLQYLKRSKKQLTVFCSNSSAAVEARNQVFAFQLLAVVTSPLA